MKRYVGDKIVGLDSAKAAALDTVSDGAIYYTTDSPYKVYLKENGSWQQISSSAGGGSDLNNTGQILHRDIHVVSGNLYTSGQLLHRDVHAVSGNLHTTGDVLHRDVHALSGNLYTSGQLLHRDVHAVSGNLYTSGQLLHRDVDAISGNLHTTGDILHRDVHAVSGNLYTSGQLLHRDIHTVSGVAEGKASDVFKTIAVQNEDDVVAAGITDTLTFVAGSNTTITTDSTNQTVTICSAGAAGGEANVQADWTQSSNTSDAFILNKPGILGDSSNYAAGSLLPEGNASHGGNFLRKDGSWAIPFTLSAATNSALGGIKIGYTTNAKKYAVQLNSEKAYVDVPWTDTWQAVSTSQVGYVAALPTNGGSADTTKFLRGDGSWEVPAYDTTNTTYDLAVPNSTTNIVLTGSDSTTDTVELVGGTNVTLSCTASNQITINSSDQYTGTVTSVTAASPLLATAGATPEISLPTTADVSVKTLTTAGADNCVSTTCLKGAYDAASLTGNIDAARLPETAKCQGTLTAHLTDAEIRTCVGTGNEGVIPAQGTAGHYLKHNGAFGAIALSDLPAAAQCAGTLTSSSELNATNLCTGTVNADRLPETAKCQGTLTAHLTDAEIRTCVGTGNEGVIPTQGTAGHYLKHNGAFGAIALSDLPAAAQCAGTLTSSSQLNATNLCTGTVNAARLPDTAKCLGTVTSVSGGTGLSGTVTGSGSLNLNTATATVIGGIKLSTNTAADTSNGIVTPNDTDGRHYGLQLDQDGLAIVNVPWVNTTYAPMGLSNSYAAGLVPAGSATHSNEFLRRDGIWVTPTDTNTTYDLTVPENSVSIALTDSGSGSDLVTLNKGNCINITCTGTNTLTIATCGLQNYTLPIAASNTLGGIKVSTGLTIDASTGALSVTVPTANDFTNACANKLNGIATLADNYGSWKLKVNSESGFESIGTAGSVNLIDGGGVTVSRSGGDVTFGTNFSGKTITAFKLCTSGVNSCVESFHGSFTTLCTILQFDGTIICTSGNNNCVDTDCLKGAYDAASLTGNIDAARLPATAKCQGDITCVTAGAGLIGGGDTGDVTLCLNLGDINDSTTNSDGACFAVVNSSNVQKLLAKGSINISEFNNDSNFTSNTGTVTSVSGGTGLSATAGNTPSISLDDTTVTAGSYTRANITVDAQGRLTSAANGTDADTQNTYTSSWVDSSDNIILRLTEGGAGSGNQDINILAGNNITLTHTDANNITIASTDTTLPIAASNTLGGIKVSTGLTINASTGALSVTVPTANDFTNTLKNKLDGICVGATANDTNANLLARANHTGSQTASTISDFDTEVANNTTVAANTAKVSAFSTNGSQAGYVCPTGTCTNYCAAVSSANAYLGCGTNNCVDVTTVKASTLVDVSSGSLNASCIDVGTQTATGAITALKLCGAGTGNCVEATCGKFTFLHTVFSMTAGLSMTALRLCATGASNCVEATCLKGNLLATSLTGTIDAARLPVATGSALGGIKVGDRLTITDGVLSADVQTGSNTTYDLAVPNSTTNIVLTGSDSTTDTVQLVGSGNVTLCCSASNQITITSSDQYTGTVTSVSGGTGLSGAITGSGSLNLDKATATALGGIKVSTGLTINASTGALSVTVPTANDFTNACSNKLSGLTTGFSAAGADSDFVCPRGSVENYCAKIICSHDNGNCIKGSIICATSAFHGEGSNITDLDASEIKSGTVATTYLPAAALYTGTVNNVGSTADDVLGISSASICAHDAGSDKIVFWDDSVGALKYLTAGSNLSISGTTITATNTNTTYNISTGGDSNDACIKLNAGGSGSGTDSICICGGTDIKISCKSASAICICYCGTTGGSGTVTSSDQYEAAYYCTNGTIVDGAANIHIWPGASSAPGAVEFFNCSSGGTCGGLSSSDSTKGSLYAYGSSRHPYWRDGSGTCYSICLGFASDYRYKTNLTSWSSLCCSTNVIKNTPVYRFNWNEAGGAVNPLEGTSVNKVGFLAHELQTQLPNTGIVRGEKDATNEEGVIVPQNIDEKGLIAVLWAALQENIEKVEDLEERVKTLESS